MHFPAASPWLVCCGRARNVTQTCNENKANIYLTKGEKKKKREKNIVIPGNRCKRNLFLYEVCSWEGIKIPPHSAFASTCFCGRWGLFQCPHCDINHIPVPDAGKFHLMGSAQGNTTHPALGLPLKRALLSSQKRVFNHRAFYRVCPVCLKDHRDTTMSRIATHPQKAKVCLKIVQRAVTRMIKVTANICS